jgi:hypothetical protein
VDRRARELLENDCGFALGARPSGLSMLPESADLEADCARAREELGNLLRLDLQAAAGLLTAAVRATPAFEPHLASGKRKTPAASFKDRLAPR